jgi:mannitol/fructose-specific phosphotransferase system IIA component (Ntr-type)
MLLLRDPTAITHEGTRKEVRVIFCLAPIDRISHVDALGQLLNLLNDSKRYRQLLEAESTRDIRLIFDQVSSQAGNDE